MEDVGSVASESTFLPMDSNAKLSSFDGELLSYRSLYMRLVCCLFYLTISWLDITFFVHKLSQFVFESCDIHLAVFNHLLRYPKATHR